MRPSAILRRLEDELLRRLGRGDPGERRIERLRARGVKIGARCMILSDIVSTEPYLIEIGEHVAISSGVELVTHDGVAWLMRDQHPAMQVFGRIRIGDHSGVGANSVVLPGTTIGRHCVIGAGSVVRGTIPDGSVYIGVPARFAGRTDELFARLRESPDRLDVFGLPPGEREARIRRHFGL